MRTLNSFKKYLTEKAIPMALSETVPAKMQNLYYSCTNPCMVKHGPRVFVYIKLAHKILSNIIDCGLPVKVCVVNVNTDTNASSFVMIKCTYEGYVYKWYLDVADDEGFLDSKARNNDVNDMLSYNIPSRFQPYVNHDGAIINVHLFDDQIGPISSLIQAI